VGLHKLKINKQHFHYCWQCYIVDYEVIITKKYVVLDFCSFVDISIYGLPTILSSNLGERRLIKVTFWSDNIDYKLFRFLDLKSNLSTF